VSDDLLVSADAGAAWRADWAPQPESTAALVAAAGRGTRLGFHLPKVLYPVNGRPLLEWIGERLGGLVGTLALVLSPEGERGFNPESIVLPMPVTVAVQAQPTGMADAVLAASPLVLGHPSAETLVVLWGDQMGIARETIERALAVHARHPQSPAVTIPLATVDSPYVHYEFSGSGRLARVLQRREGETLPPTGLADCGCFVVSTRTVFPILRRLATSNLLVGRLSREQNFLQALPYIARDVPVVGVLGASLVDTIGLNSAADLDRLARAVHPRPTTDR
jgi:bifunctional UDP-N-acetylglucosamine pyrophosphorylase / glucosamine-1-phosphate N-acetyltransferase